MDLEPADTPIETKGADDAAQDLGTPAAVEPGMLNVAAELIETAAYDLTGLQTSPCVARLILMSAEVARVAAVVRDDSEDIGRVC